MPGFESEIVQIIIASSFITQLVLVVLLFFSIFSWAIIFYKYSVFRKAGHENQAFLSLYWKMDDLVQLRKASARFKQSPLVKIFLAGLDRIDPALTLRSEEDLRLQEDVARQVNVKILERTLKRTAEEEIAGMEHYLSFLATTGNVTPFIGLFGTVLGIIDSFHEISRQGTASITAVAPGVAEALVATAAGLLAAIPAVVAFNYYSSRVRNTASEIETFSTDFLSLMEERLIPAKTQREVSR
jgi:biopolymer transport protein TolQ